MTAEAVRSSVWVMSLHVVPSGRLSRCACCPFSGFPGIRTPSPRPASPFYLSFGSHASVHSSTMALPPDQNYSGVVTQHSPSSTPRVACPGRRACSSILMPSNILAQSVCPRGKHLSSDSGPVAISMGCRERCGPCRTGRSPSRPSARSASAGEARRPRGRGPPAAPGRAWSGGALAPGPGVVRAGPGGWQPRAPRSRGHSQPRAPAARLSPACQSRPGPGCSGGRHAEPPGGGGGDGGGRGRGRECRGGLTGWGGAGGAAGSRAGRSGPRASGRSPRTTPVPWCARGAARFRAGAGGGGILRPGAASPLLKLPDI